MVTRMNWSKTKTPPFDWDRWERERLYGDWRFEEKQEYKHLIKYTRLVRSL